MRPASRTHHTRHNAACSGRDAIGLETQHQMTVLATSTAVELLRAPAIGILDVEVAWCPPHASPLIRNVKEVEVAVDAA